MIMQQTFMPKVAYLASHDPERGLLLIWSSLWTIIIGVFLSLSLYFVGPYIIEFFFGPEYTDAIKLIRVLCVLPLIINIRICMADLYMFNYGHERAFALFTACGLVVFLTTLGILSYWLDGATAVAFGAVAGEGFVALASTIFFFGSALARRRHVRAAEAVDA
jgi:O-antigen/teichoic acid export membrane protein